MDFMKWLNSLDEALYEVVSWLAFYPLTIWRVASRPLSMMGYAEEQLRLPLSEQFREALRPPLFLTLVLLTAHAVGVALGQADAIVADRRGLAGFISDDATALLFRAILFAALPLMAAARFVRGTGEAFNRDTLRAPFYAQCYPTALLALGLSLAVSSSKLGVPSLRVASGGLGAAAVVFYLAVQTRWFSARLDCGKLRGFVAASLGLIEGFLLLLVVAGLLKVSERP